MPVRQYAYALFDVGALHCRALPRCQGCGLAAGCGALRSGLPVVPPPPRQAAYQGSLRQLRGALLAAALAADGTPTSALRTAVSSLPGATEQRIELALAGLVADGLLRDDA
jgi:A/G-specific adenine glycosylase